MNSTPPTSHCVVAGQFLRKCPVFDYWALCLRFALQMMPFFISHPQSYLTSFEPTACSLWVQTVSTFKRQCIDSIRFTSSYFPDAAKRMRLRILLLKRIFLTASFPMRQTWPLPHQWSKWTLADRLSDWNVIFSTGAEDGGVSALFDDNNKIRLIRHNVDYSMSWFHGSITYISTFNLCHIIQSR